MRKIATVIALFAAVTAQQVFADDSSSTLADSAGNKSCATIAQACLSAGFVRAQSATKGIWHDCMKPIIVGKAVSGVTVDSAVVKSCRAQKIEELKTELQDLEKAN